MTKKGKEPELEDVLKAGADGTAPAVSVTFIDASEKFRGEIDREVIEQLIRAGALDRVNLYLPWDAFEALLRREMHEALIRGIVRGADLASSATQRAIHQALGTEPLLTFDATNPRVLHYIRTNTARLVTVETKETKDAIRDVIARAMREEMPPIEVHRQIKAVIGLNRRQGLALENYRRGLVAQDTPNSVVASRVETFRRKQLAFRADMIARTETMDAVNQGHLEGQRQARDKGWFGSKRGFKEWVTAPEDGRVCPTCRAMSGKRVPLDTQFSVTIYTIGGKARGTVKVDTPPVHPHCRCTHLLVLE